MSIVYSSYDHYFVGEIWFDFAENNPIFKDESDDKFVWRLLLKTIKELETGKYQGFDFDKYMIPQIIVGFLLRFITDVSKDLPLSLAKKGLQYCKQMIQELDPAMWENVNLRKEALLQELKYFDFLVHKESLKSRKKSGQTQNKMILRTRKNTLTKISKKKSKKISKKSKK